MGFKRGHKVKFRHKYPLHQKNRELATGSLKHIKDELDTCVTPAQSKMNNNNREAHKRGRANTVESHVSHSEGILDESSSDEDDCKLDKHVSFEGSSPDMWLDVAKGNIKPHGVTGLGVSKKSTGKVIRPGKRKKIIMEIVKTEEEYLAHLTNIVEYHIKRIKKSDICTEDEQKSLFSHIDLIHGLHDKIYKEFLKKIDDFDEHKTLIGEVFCNYYHFFKMYQTYINLHENANHTLVRLMKTNTSFKEHCDHVYALCKNQPLDALLIRPIQRLPRYSLLLKELLKYTDEEHPDFLYIEKALLEVTKVNLLINTKIAEQENRNRVRTIEKRFFKNPKLQAVHRKFVREGTLKKYGVNAKKWKTYTWFLFSDILVQATYNRVFGLSLSRIINIDDKFEVTPANSLDFEIHSSFRERSFYLRAKDEDEKGW
eukprot:UN30103